MIIRLFSVFYLGLALAFSVPAQDTVRLHLKGEGDSAFEGFAYSGPAGNPIRLTWRVEQENVYLEKGVPGRLMVRASKDDKLGPSDVLILDSLCAIPPFNYNSSAMRHKLPAGDFFLFASYEVQPLPGLIDRILQFQSRIRLFEVRFPEPTVWVSAIPGEFSENVEVHLAAQVQLSCCGPQFRKLSSQWEIGLGDAKGRIETSLTTSYRSDSLPDGPLRISLHEEIFNEFKPKKSSMLVVQIRSAYLENGFIQLPEQTFVLPLQVVRDPASMVKRLRQEFPYLTYGDFEIRQPTLDFSVLRKEAETLYRFVQGSLQSVRDGNASQALAWSDSAFAYAGLHPVSTVVYAAPGLISGLYSGFGRWLDKSEAGKAFLKKENPGFRLGHAMRMERLIDSAYHHLIRRILPESLDQINEVESDGFFEEGKDPFRKPALLDFPVVWRERTKPAIAHFVRTRDLETADRILSQAAEHLELVQPLWEMLAGDTLLRRCYEHLGNSLTENNELLDVALSRLEFLAALGYYPEAQVAVKTSAMAQRLSYDFQPYVFWNLAGEFYESVGETVRADSLFNLSDQYLSAKAATAKTDPWRERLLMGNHARLDAALKPYAVAVSDTARWIADLRKAQSNWMIATQMNASRSFARKLGFMGVKGYDSHYLAQIKLLQTQNQYFLANEWMKDLAFFLGRENRTTDALRIYRVLMPVNNLQSQAFRMGFSEQAQLFHLRQQQQLLSRYLNTLLNSSAILPKAAYDSLLADGLEQSLYVHGFLLRGSRSLMRNIKLSGPKELQFQVVLWEELRKYLNELYLSGKATPHEVSIWREKILATESQIARLSRQASDYQPDRPINLDSVRNNLKTGEVAVEIVRTQINDEIYHGRKVRYLAFVVGKEGPARLVVFPTDGDQMEGRYFRFHRNSIQQQTPDKESYAVYWAPLAEAVGGARRIHFAPDGIFHLINPNMLMNTATGKFLVDEAEVRLVNSVGTMKPAVKFKPASAMVLGNARFSDQEAIGKEVQRTTRAVLLNNPVAPLPGTKEEVETLAALLRQRRIPVKILTGNDATKAAVTSSVSADVLHIATHGFWQDATPGSGEFADLLESYSSSGLLLSGAQSGTSEKGFRINPAGILTAAEIRDLDLNATRLVILSACETGLGEIVPGGGLYGLKRALVQAGTSNVVTSLWKVDDQATREFMTNFYEGLLSNGDLENAYRNAMMKLRESYPDPFYWGAFVLSSE